jgi:hypothetical protein
VMTAMAALLDDDRWFVVVFTLGHTRASKWALLLFSLFKNRF